VRSSKIDADGARQLIARLDWADDLRGLANSEVVVEAVVESSSAPATRWVR
jgi:hypothetical protein